MHFLSLKVKQQKQKRSLVLFSIWFLFSKLISLLSRSQNRLINSSHWLLNLSVKPKSLMEWQITNLKLKKYFPKNFKGSFTQEDATLEDLKSNSRISSSESACYYTEESRRLLQITNQLHKYKI